MISVGFAAALGAGVLAAPMMFEASPALAKTHANKTHAKETLREQDAREVRG